MDVTILIALISIIICVFLLSWFAGSNAPYIPTDLSKLRKILKTYVKKGSIFYDLGSGDGRVAIEAAKLGAEAHGFEQSWLRVIYSRIKAQKHLAKAYFYHGNLFNRHYYPADIVYIYMVQDCMDKLEEKLKKELKQGAVVIVKRYPFKKWQPVKRIGDFWIYMVKSI